MQRELGPWMVAVFLGLSLADGDRAQAGHIICGAVLGPGGKFVLDSDVGPCPGLGPAITVNFARLDLNGFSVICGSQYFNSNGIEVTGTEAKVRNGIVEDCNYGVVLQGRGSHDVHNVTAHDNFIGFLTLSDHNTLSQNTAPGNNTFGFYTHGSDNTLTENTSTANNVGFELNGRNSRTEDNIAIDCNTGFGISGLNHRVNGNTASSGSIFGFMIGPAANIRLIENTASGFTYGFFVVSAGPHILTDNTATSNSDSGFSLFSFDTLVKNNTASNNGQHGFSVEHSARDKFVGNTAINNGGSGFNIIVGNNHLLQGNTAHNNGGNGVFLSTGASNHRILKTKASGNGGFDLQDDNVNCGTNLWSNNTGTKSQGCIN